MYAFRRFTKKMKLAECKQAVDPVQRLRPCYWIRCAANGAFIPPLGHFQFAEVGKNNHDGRITDLRIRFQLPTYFIARNISKDRIDQNQVWLNRRKTIKRRFSAY